MRLFELILRHGHPPVQGMDAQTNVLGSTEATAQNFAPLLEVPSILSVMAMCRALLGLYCVSTEFPLHQYSRTW